MRLDKKLNLIIPIDRDDGTRVHIYHTPISRDVYTQYFRVLNMTGTQIYADDLSFFGGPESAFLMLKEISQNTTRPNGSGSWWDGENGVEKGLIEEIWRKTQVLNLGPSGWDLVPFDMAIARGPKGEWQSDILSEDEASEVSGSLIFFTCSVFMRQNPVISRGLLAAAALLDWQLSSLSLTDYRTFLLTSTTDEPTEESPTATALSIPA